MKKTDLTIDKVTTPEALRHQLRLLMHDRETEIAMVQVLLEGISRRHLEAYNNIALIHVIDWATRSVQSISTSLIVARILEIDDRTMNNIK